MYDRRMFVIAVNVVRMHVLERCQEEGNQQRQAGRNGGGATHCDKFTLPVDERSGWPEKGWSERYSTRHGDRSCHLRNALLAHAGVLSA